MSESSNYTPPTIRGRVLTIGDEQTFGSSFRKRMIVVETGFKFPNPIPVNFTRDNVAKLDGVKHGDYVTIRYRIDGREWNGPNGVRYFVDLTGVDIEVLGTEKRASAKVATSSDAVDAWNAAHPDKPLTNKANAAEFQKLCRETCPKIAEYAAGRGEKFSQCAQPRDWQAIIDRIRGTDADAPAEADEPTADEELPF